MKSQLTMKTEERLKVRNNRIRTGSAQLDKYYSSQVGTSHVNVNITLGSRFLHYDFFLRNGRRQCAGKLFFQFRAGDFDFVVFGDESDPTVFEGFEFLSGRSLVSLPLPVDFLDLAPRVRQLPLLQLNHVS